MRISRIGYHLAHCALLWLGFALALQLLDRFPLREDEAIYSFWALHGWRVDPFFLTVWPDKPPLFLGALAVAFQLWGASQASGRLLNILLTLLTALVVGAIARRLWGNRSGFVATALYLLNPFVLSFAPTIFTDPMLVLAGQVALWLALTDRSLGAGFWLAVAMMTKQQGVLYIPLILGLLGLQPWLASDGPASRCHGRWLRFGLGALLVLAPLFYWDSRRWAVAPSPWDLSIRNYGAFHFVSPTQWLARGNEWARLLWYFTASWPVWFVLALLLISALFWQSKRDLAWTMQGVVGCWLALWGGGFFLFHVVTTIQLWDRYLLPLAPLFALLAAWAFHQVDTSCFAKNFVRWSVVSILGGLLLFTPPALAAARGDLPIGGDHGDYSGLTAAMIWLQQEAPAASILYQQRLGWHYQFYLYDEVATGRITLRWFGTSIYLAANAAQTPAQPRFLLLPDWAPQPNLPLHLALRRIDLVPVARFGRMTLYALHNQPQSIGRCTWCLCQGPRPWPGWLTRNLQWEALQP